MHSSIYFRCDKCHHIWEGEKEICPKCQSKLYIFPVINQYDDVEKLQGEIAEWTNKTFGIYRNGSPIINHLKLELQEISEALDDFHQGVYSSSQETSMEILSKKRNRVLMEFADCFIILLDATSHEQITFQMLMQASKEKMKINKLKNFKNDNNI